MKVDENKNQKLPRKLRKILVEKKRRERIDGALNHIKDMLFGTSDLQNDYMRMEKADILESVVKYLQTHQTTSTSAHAQSTSHSRYNKGYTQCVREVTRLMTHLCGSNSQITQSLSHYLNTKVNSLKGQAVAQERLHGHTQNRNVPKQEDILRMPSLPDHTETTSASSVPTNQERRIPAFHSPQSAFHPVSNSSRNLANSAPTPAENISIAVYQYNHYNNFKNDKSRANVESNINIRPVVQDDSYLTDTHGYDTNSDISSNINARSNINIHPVVHKDSESHSKDMRFEHRNLDFSLMKENLVKAGDNANQPFVKQESGMWRPW